MAAMKPPSSARSWRSAAAATSARFKACMAAGLSVVFFIWLVTPTSGKLYRPSDHANPIMLENQDSEIVNSIVIPSYNEAPNMAPLVSRIFQAIPPDQVRHTEILVIDDNSQDSTSSEIEILREQGYNVHLHVRKTERGLSSAVLHGFTLAQGKKLLVMDADLQHPPESVTAFLEALNDPPRPLSVPFGENGGKAAATLPEEKKPKFALGTRYAKGYEMDRDWPFYRRLISWGARLLSRPLTNAQDPMGGFFALRKDLFLASQPLNPSGFKIGLELLLKTPLLSTQLVHVPYGFAKRQVGSSKLGMKVIIKYIGQLLALYQWKFGLLFHIFVFACVSIGLNCLVVGLDWSVKKLGLEENPLARYVLINRRQKRRHKNDV